MVKRNEIHAMKLKLRENLFFELKIQIKNHLNYVVKLPPFPPGMGTGVKILETGDTGTGDLTFYCGWGTRGRVFFLSPGGSKL